ncbi:alpha-galactosidase [Algibacter amylolyticus]|uniref:Alpha-galactosidase n=1 Tax=Algibacter amylolyticus TaxID=1608400 RepID=A0A5M7B762_9FLAO|nr:alpha-galactosidase [Algibacter amylolyticus]KAA5825139.1 alpha-galactosidase [Algibacter amylolyticus]MBB5268753.1 alpha-galactosidase [Algibacter amylolyticus]TSJ77633.1 alpha-galactosidase [Algibacter amylolyticus]
MKTSIDKIQLSVLLLCVSFWGLNAQVIQIGTDNTSLIYHISKNKVYQFYYGKNLQSLKGIEKMKPFFNEAYPSFGNGSSDEVGIIAVHADGTMATDLIYQSHEQNTNVNIQNTTIHLKDEKLPFFVDLHFKAYQNEDVIEQWTTISHKETNQVRLEQFASSAISFKAESYYLTHFNGSWAREMRMSEERLTNGIKNIETKRGVRTTEYENPSFILSLNQEAQENSGEVVFGSLAWMGNYRLSFQLDDQDRCQLTGGINPFASGYSLKPNTVFETPRMVLTYSSEGKNRASINLHRWTRKYNLQDGNEIRPIVLNSWEGAYFSFYADKLKSMMNGAAEMGVEVFVLDDGWFGNKYPRNSPKSGLGDWQVNKKKLPNGIDDLISHTEKLGMKFGIWVEPEMVNPQSELAKNHPDWILQRMNGREPLLQRNQLLLDLSNPKVQDFAFGVIDELLIKHPRIKYIKWDANRHVQNFGSTYLKEGNQSNLWIEYARGLESVFKRLNGKYPNVIFQACSSGGGRVDFSSMKYTHEFWASDDTDPYERIFIQWGTNHFFPPIATGAHITKSPNHQTGRETSLKFRSDVAFGGRLGIELSPDDLKPEELEFSKEAVKLYKEIRSVVQFGDLYRLQSPYDNDGYASINYVSGNKDEAILMVYSHDFHRRYERNFVRLQGLDTSANYRITEVNKVANKSHIEFNEDIVSGGILMNRGIKVDLKKPLESAIFQLKKVSQ